MALPILTWIAHTHLRSTSPLYNFFFSPSDLYTDLASETFDMTKTGNSIELPFISKYPGNHWVVVLVENPAELQAGYGSDFKVKVSIKDGTEIVSETITDNSKFWFYGGTERSGFALSTYKIPKDWQLNHPLIVSAEVLKPSQSFENKYGSQRIVVSKFSDE